MTPQELIDRLNAIREMVKQGLAANPLRAIHTLVEDIKADGVLDVQAPNDTAESMPKKGVQK